MGKVVQFNGEKREDVPISEVLDHAKTQLEGGVVLIGYDKSGELYFASSYADNALTLWLLENAKHELIRYALDPDDGPDAA